MSLATYVGINYSVPTDDTAPELYTDDFWIGNCFSDDECRANVKKHQFSTTHVYEVSSHWGIEIYMDQDKVRKKESIDKLEQLLNILSIYISPGDYFELYSCWVGEEAEPREGDITINMNDLDIHNLEILEKTLVRFQY